MVRSRSRSVARSNGHYRGQGRGEQEGGGDQDLEDTFTIKSCYSSSCVTFIAVPCSSNEELIATSYPATAAQHVSTFHRTNTTTTKPVLTLIRGHQHHNVRTHPRLLSSTHGISNTILIMVKYFQQRKQLLKYDTQSRVIHRVREVRDGDHDQYVNMSQYVNV